MINANPTTEENIPGIIISLLGRDMIRFITTTKMPFKQQKIAKITNVTFCRITLGESFSETLIFSKKFQRFLKYFFIIKLFLVEDYIGRITV